jgi:DEAD/DEAH box helicase domain-containing protein
VRVGATPIDESAGEPERAPVRVTGPLERFVGRLEKLGVDRLGGRVSSVQWLEPRPAEAGRFALPAAARHVLGRRGIETLYSHQASALEEWSRGRDVLLATGTASGKSLVYNLAAALRLLDDPGARALFVFPLKALEQDQLAGLRADLAALGGGLRAEIYDGDTSPYQRKRIREDPPAVLLCTPDMLHQGILPWHPRWREFLSRLSLVVIDEVHTYRGVLGAHMAQVVRRLLRVAAHHGAAPRMIACSATIADPAPFARELLGREVAVVERDGSPRPGLGYVFVDPELSPYTAASRLFRLCLAEGLRTIAFTGARRATELMHAWIVEADPALAARVSSYRSGFLPEERREIERRLFSGELAGVISTSALEMGIDVGGLDACILVGYPGSVLATRQRAGRVGRGREGLVFVVPQADALDRYFLTNPREIVTRPCEQAVLDAANDEILAAHLPCAAAELPLAQGEPWLADARVAAGRDGAVRRGTLLESAAGGEWFASRPRPALEVSLRQAGEAFAIRSLARGPKGRSGEVIGTIGGGRVFSECHAGAIYLHRARSYRVRELDLEQREVRVEGPVKVDYYTRALAEKETEILEVQASRPLGNALAKLGRLRITSRTTRYEQRRVFGQDLIGTHALELPPQQFETQGAWIELAPEIETLVAGEDRHFMGAIHGLEHAALALFPLFALCDRLDVAGISIPRHPQVRGPAVFLYDAIPGGIGISRALFPKLGALLEATREVVAACPCEEGCPSCVHSPRCSAGNRPLDKPATVRVLDLVLGSEPLPAGKPREDAEAEPRPRAAAAPAAPAPVFFDVETQRSAEEVGGWHNTHLMRLALAVVYDAGDDRFETYGEDRAEELVERLARAPLVVGFNVKRFDYRVLRAYTARDFAKIPTFDLLEDLQQRLGHRIGLGHLGQETLARDKTADGLQSLEWFRQGDLARVEAYCRADVELMRDLVAYAMREGHVRIRRRDGNAVRVPVEWDAVSMQARARQA